MESNEERRERLMNWLFEYAFRLGFGIEMGYWDPYFRSRAIEENKLIILNLRWHNKNEIPFILAHEISHLENKDSGVLYYAGFTAKSKFEFGANVGAIRILLEYSLAQDDGFTEPYKFVEAYGIPAKFNYVAEYFFKNSKLFG